MGCGTSGEPTLGGCFPVASPAPCEQGLLSLDQKAVPWASVFLFGQQLDNPSWFWWHIAMKII